MKKWSEFLLWVLCFLVIDTSTDMLKSFIENNMLNSWYFVLVCFTLFVLMWIGVLFGIKALKNKPAKKSEKKRDIISGLIYFVLIWSVFMVFDVIKYSLENNLLNHWIFFTASLVSIFIGWAGCRLGDILHIKKK